MQFICEHCKIKFIGKIKYRIYQFCSAKCSNRFHCVGKHPPTFKGKIKRSGYWYLYLPDHPNVGKQGYFAEHRFIMEKYLGRQLKKSEVVHHKNHNITDNRIENLKLFSSHGQHTANAHPEIYEKQKIMFKGKNFSPQSGFKKGQIPWNKGIPMSQQSKEKMIATKLSKKH